MTKKTLYYEKLFTTGSLRVDGVRYSPLLKCDHDMGIDDNTIRLVTEPPSPFKPGVVSEYKEVNGINVEELHKKSKIHLQKKRRYANRT